MTAQFGIGVYTAPEAARLIGMRRSTLRRWLGGSDDDNLWRVQHEHGPDERLLLGFRDLIEARIVDRLRRLGFSLQSLRVIMERARDEIGEEHPLSTRHFKHDGQRIYLQITSGLAEPRMIDLHRRQGVFQSVVAPSLRDIDYGERTARRWWLLDGKRSIVADPARSFGQPILADHGITTERIAQTVEAEGSVKAAARLFEIKPSLVDDALTYQNGLARQLTV